MEEVKYIENKGEITKEAYGWSNFLTSYIVLVFVIVMAEIVVLGNNKGQYLRECGFAIADWQDL